jgi:phage terminase Nu1 subunit (DNA packaging protein)
VSTGDPSSKPEPIITGEQLETIRKKDIANLIRKVKDGRTLTAAERRIIESAAGQEEPAKELVSTARVAELFNVSRKTIYAWRNAGLDGVPKKVGGKEDLAEWRAWFAANPSAGHYDGKPRRDRESLLCSKLEIEIQIADLKLKKVSRELMPVAEARESATRIYSAVKAELLKMTSELPPSLSGLGEVEIQKKLRAAVITILTDLSSETNTAFEAKDEEDEDAG